MSAAAEGDILRDRLRKFLAFARPHVLSAVDRLSQLRRLHDVRLRRYCIGKAQVTATDVCALVADSRTGRFDAAAAAAGIVKASQLAAPLAPLGEDMGLVLEACLLQQVLGDEKVVAVAKEFVAAQGALQEAAPRVAPKTASTPLPPAIAKLLGGARELWAFPAPALAVLRLLQTPDVQPDAVAAELEKDGELAGRWLRLVNAASFGQAEPTGSLKRAVVALGYPLVHRFVAVAAIVGRLGGGPEPWAHALRTAHAASLVARTAKAGHPDEHFAAGLLHDVGQRILQVHLPEAWKEVVDGGGPLAAAEQRRLGTGHAEIGACLLERWRLPASVVAAARHHDGPAEAFEEIQLPREALVVAAACRLVRDTPDLQRWIPCFRLPTERVAVIREEAARRAEACLKEFA